MTKRWVKGARECLIAVLILGIADQRHAPAWGKIDVVYLLHKLPPFFVGQGQTLIKGSVTSTEPFMCRLAGVL
jgi:hypothetical protein